MFAKLMTLALYWALSALASSWIIIRKDGSRVECDGPFVIVDGAYTYLGKNGEPIRIPAEEVDASKTDAANSGVAAAGPNGALLAVNRPAALGPATGDLVITFHAPYSAPPAQSWSALGVRPAEERFFVHVPASYTGGERFGVIVYSGPDDQASLPAGWSKVLEAKKLLFVAPQGSGNSRRISRRLGLAVLGALEIQKLYPIDPARVYAAGFSGGARVANELAFYDPELFQGAILNSGAEFYGKPDGQTMVKPPPKRLALVRRRMRFAIITGSRDPRRASILDIYYGGYRAHGYHARLFDVEGLGHDPCSAPTLAQAIDFVE